MPLAASGCDFFSISLSPASPPFVFSCLCEVFLGDKTGLRLSLSFFFLKSGFMDIVDTEIVLYG